MPIGEPPPFQPMHPPSVFPLGQNYSNDPVLYQAMTLREWYAGMALCGLLSCKAVHKALDDAAAGNPDKAIPALAALAFANADAMLEAAKKK